ncbi:MAG: dynamin family protein [Spirulinaceae cyanobacterium]
MNPTNTNTRAERIESIIAQRRPLAEEIQWVEMHLRELYTAIRELESYRQNLTNSVGEVEVKEQLSKGDFSPLLQQIQTEVEKLNTLRERFSRPTLNIGVVGLMGQGKSTLLKSLSGLSDKEIPALEGGACTAVRSTIENQPGDTVAEVTLHSEESFLTGVIWLYYDELGLANKPQSLDEFASQTLIEPPSLGATKEKMYKHLKEDYHQNLSKYRYLIKPGEPQKFAIKQEEIPDYVIQKRDGQDKLTTFKHLAVREVVIFCRFENPDVGKVSLVDVPGMGDSRLGDEKLILKTLGKEVDVVLFIRRPDPMRYQWQPVDTQLYDTATQALNNLENRSFMVLNYSKRTNNLKACQTLQQNIDTIQVVRCEIADCSEPKDANRVFDLVLDYLAVNINEIDKRYARECQTRLIELQEKIAQELATVRPALAKYGRESSQFRVLFNQLLQDVVNGLVDLRNELKAKSEDIDLDFQTAVENALENCLKDSGIPQDQEICDRSRTLEFKESYAAVYRIYIVELRIHLSQHFLLLDKGLNKSVEKMKTAVAEVLIKQGRLGELIPSRGTEFLQEMADLLAQKQNQLELGFRTLGDFEFSYSSSLLRFIRKHLSDNLQADVDQPLNSIENALNQEENQVLTEPTNPSEVRSNLEKLHQQVISQCRQTLENWLKAPSQVRYYMVEEFADRILYAKNIRGEWEDFLSDEEIRIQVWPEFKELANRKRVQEEWQNKVAQVAKLNQLAAMMFIN